MGRKILILLILILCLTTLVFTQWKRVESPGIRVPVSTDAIAAKGDTLLVGTYRGTIYRSTDSGLNWAISDSGLSNVYWIFDFLLLGDTVFALGEAGIFYSTNIGETWEVKNNGLRRGTWINVYSVVRSGIFLFAATDFGVYRSSNNGNYWYPSSGDSGYWPIRSLAVSNEWLFAGTDGLGIFRSSDNGNSWNAVSSGLPYYPPAVHPYEPVNKLLVDGENIYAGASGVFRSSDYGNSWVPETLGLSVSGNLLAPICSFAKIGQYIFAGTQDYGIYRLTSNGSPWIPVNGGLQPNSYVTSIIGSAGHIYAGTVLSGMYFSSSQDSIAWLPLFTEYPGTVDVGILGASGNNLFLNAWSEYYNGSISGTFRSSDFGNIWYRDSILSSKSISSFQSFGDSVYAVGGGGVFYSSNNGSDWEKINSTLWFNKTLLKVDDTLYLGWDGIFGGIYLSPNNGGTWIEIWRSDTAVFALANIGNNLFAGSDGGVFRSTNSGLNWIAINNGLPSNGKIYSFVTIKGSLLASTWYGIYLSNNNGDSWSSGNNGLLIDTTRINNSIPLLLYENQLFAGTMKGIYFSTNQGTQWISAVDGLTGDATNIRSVAIHQNDLVISTADGLWHRPISEILSVKKYGDLVPKEYMLYQNFPNPYNPSTRISYSIPHTSNVSLIVYDILGREVARLVQGTKPPGEYSVTWNAAKVPSGVYYYRLVAGSFVQTKKMIVMK